MRFAIFLSYVLTISLFNTAHCNSFLGEMLTPEEPSELIVYNRILAKVNSHTISVIDVMKKMDLFLQRYYPEVTHSKSARFQYYSSQWKETLSQMIDHELMLADAEQIELKVSDSEVRESLLERFGPAIMQTLDQIGLTYEEARSMIYTELVVQRMIWYRVNAKALGIVNPKEIKNAYKKYCEQNPPLEEWKYQVLSLRSIHQKLGEALAKKASYLLHSAALTLPLVSEQIQTSVDPEHPVTILLSPELTADAKTISQSHKDVLQKLKPGLCSEPIAQISRADQSTVYRIFHLKEHLIKQPPSFEKLAETLKDELLQEAASKENSKYIAKLRSRLGYDEQRMMENIPDDFHPFALR